METLFTYAKSIVDKSGNQIESGEIFAKVLTRNDDSGRHGVCLPTDVYSFFPELNIPDQTKNTTDHFKAFDPAAASWKTLAYKYYERYPERRVTRLPGILNDREHEPRLLVFMNIRHRDGGSAYYFDCMSGETARLGDVFRLIFGSELQLAPGVFIVRPIDSPVFTTDEVLAQLLSKFDTVKEKGWIDTLREGDTGIGYTFETLVGIEENNDKTADFNGIEIKCKGIKEGKTASLGKINIFQSGPTWITQQTARERIQILGKLGADGLYACHSQVTTAANNLGLLLQILSENSNIDLLKNAEALGFWSFGQLEKRLLEKHSRAAFIKARVRNTKSKTQYSYEEFVYCDRPSIQRFVELVSQRKIVFEFLMHEQPDGTVRNRGYPWRLVREELLDQLFAFQIKLR